MNLRVLCYIKEVKSLFISSKDNPKIKRLIKLLGSKKERREQRLFVAEGMRSCVDAVHEYLAGRLEIEALFYVKEAAESFAGKLDVAAFSSLDEKRVIEIPMDLAQKVSDEGSSQGAFVVARFVDKPLPDVLVGRKYLILEHLQDPGNLGTVLRTADAVGVDGVVLTGNCTELYNPKVVRSTMGSLSRVTIYNENDLDRVVSVLKASGHTVIASVVRDGVLLSGYSFPSRCAVIIGNEGNGLSDNAIISSDERVTIDMHGFAESLNASVAAAVFLWEMTKE